MGSGFLFPQLQMPAPLLADLARLNPWWEGSALPLLPTTRRHLVRIVQRALERRLAPIVVVRGPRQIGKTTAQLQVLADLLERGVPPTSILRVQCDELPSLGELPEPILRIVDWYEAAVLGCRLSESAHRGRPTYLFFDEVQNVRDWAPQLKALVDSSTTQIVVTGSSALRIEAGRDSLAGRITTLDVGVLSLTEIAAFRGLDRIEPAIEENGLESLADSRFWRGLVEFGNRHAAQVSDAFDAFSERGGYPLMHQHPQVPWSTLAEQLNETVIRRVIQHDLRVGERGRKRDAPLLEELFRLACRYVGQSPPPQTLAREVQRTLGGNVGPQRVRQYLRFLGDTLLLRLIEPLEIRLKRARGHAKICLVDHGLRASWLQEIVPLSPAKLRDEPHLTTLAGHVAESVVGATLSTIGGLGIAHLPERPDQPEIDFVVTIGTKRIPVEVKYQQQIDPLRDTESIRTFLEKTVNNAPLGLLVTQRDVSLPDPRIVPIPLATFLLLR